ncbi:MAG: BlaI/MecI/CopY family transcriptional regulator [Proteobacteria bacterium]|nr:BlaI/MecI/CopY family transcriptional regulator [Pseudomonadota bacterium]
MKLTLTDREADVMQVLWDNGPSVVAEVRQLLADPLAYTTVLTVLQTLETKGFVGHEAEGRGYRYFASVKQQTVRKSALKHLTDKLFNGSTELLFAHLVSDKKLTADQVKRMRQLLKDPNYPKERT